MFNEDISTLSNKNLVIIAVIMFFIMVTISINVYLSNNRDRNGNYLTLGDIIRNIFNRFDDTNLIELEQIAPVLEDSAKEAIKFVENEKNTVKKNIRKIKKKSSVKRKYLISTKIIFRTKKQMQFVKH